MGQYLPSRFNYISKTTAEAKSVLLELLKDPDLFKKFQDDSEDWLHEKYGLD